MGKLIFRLSLNNIALFVILMVITTYVIFNMGYASHDGFSKKILIIYLITALVQIVINYFMYRKQITLNPKMFFVCALIVACLYLLYPLINYIP